MPQVIKLLVIGTFIPLTILKLEIFVFIYLFSVLLVTSMFFICISNWHTSLCLPSLSFTSDDDLLEQFLTRAVLLREAVISLQTPSHSVQISVLDQCVPFSSLKTKRNECDKE